MDHDIVIVGAGISGLALHHFLRRRGADSLLLEAGSEPGGVIRSRRVDGVTMDLAPQRTRLVPAVADLIADLGLEDEIVRAGGGLSLLIYRKGRLRTVPTSPRALLRSDLLSTRGRLRLLLEPLTGGTRDDESAGAYFERKVGAEAYRALFGPLFGGLYASDPAHMPARYSLFPLLRDLGVSRSLVTCAVRRALSRRSLPPACSFRHGMQTLPIALADSHRQSIRLDAPVHRVERMGSGFAVWIGRAVDEGEAVTARRIVLTSAADVSAHLLRTIAPEAASRLGMLTYNHLRVVQLRASCALPASGYQVAFGEPLRTLGVTLNGSLFGRDRLATAFLPGGERGPGPEEAGSVAAEEFELVTGEKAVPLREDSTRIPAFDEGWAALDGLRLPDRLHLFTNYTSRSAIAARIASAASLADRLVRLPPRTR